jgi:hypothetical protein
MPERIRDGKSAASEAAHRANMSADEARLRDRAQRWLHPADELDYTIRRWVIPVPSVQADASRRVTGSARYEEAAQCNARLSEFQAAVGRYLRAQYDELAQPIPARLVELLRQVEQGTGRSEVPPGRRAEDLARA